MLKKQIGVWVLLVCFAASCALCVWAWLCAIHLLFYGIAALPAFFLQMLIRRGGKEWTWLLSIHAVILFCALGIGGFICLFGENWEPLHGMFLAAVSESALVGCVLEFIFNGYRKGEKSDEAQN